MMVSSKGTDSQRSAARWGAFVLVAALAAACGTEDPGERSDPVGSTGGTGAGGGGGSTPDPEGALLPWKPGNTWTYRVTVDGVVTEKVTTVGEEQVIGGAGPHAAELANHVVTSKLSGEDRTESWQAQVGDRVLRYRELSFHAQGGEPELEEHWDPYKLHIDGTAEHTVAGAQWTETYTETKTIPGGTPIPTSVTDAWTVEGVDVAITVPAGTFQTVVFVKLPAGKKYFYAPGIGKVKELGGQTEELVSYDLVP